MPRSASNSRIEPLDVRNGIGRPEHDGEGRVLTLEFDDFFLANVYFPHAQHGLPRIDYFCVDAKSTKRIKDAAILQEVMGSDHCPVRLDFL